MVGPGSADFGSRIAAARRRRGMSRRSLADLVGRSEEWLRLIEHGRRRLDSIEYAVRLGKALHVPDMAAFLGLRDHDVRATSPPGPIGDLARHAIMDSASIPTFSCRRAWDEAERDLDSDTEAAWRYWSGRRDRYLQVTGMLPRLLRGAAARLRTGVDGAHLGPAIAAYHLATLVYIRLGDGHLAWLTADRALGAAERAGHAWLLSAAWHAGACYLAMGYPVEAYQLASAAAEHSEPPDPEPPPEDTPPSAAIGALRLLAAEAAASAHEQWRAWDLLDRARAYEAAADGTACTVPSGRFETGISAVQVAYRLGHVNEAIRLAAEVDLPDDYPPDRQARHYILLAVLHARRNEDAAAVFALGIVAEVSPEDLGYDRRCREVLTQLLRRDNRSVRRKLERLLSLAGIT